MTITSMARPSGTKWPSLSHLRLLTGNVRCRAAAGAHVLSIGPLELTMKVVAGLIPPLSVDPVHVVTTSLSTHLSPVA